MESQFTDTIFAAVIGALAVALGTVLNQVLNIWSDARVKTADIQREISTSASICLGRLVKMRMTLERGETEVFDREKYYFGSDTDRYLKAIASRKKLLDNERDIYEQMSVVLVGSIPPGEVSDHLETLISSLEGLIT